MKTSLSIICSTALLLCFLRSNLNAQINSCYSISALGYEWGSGITSTFDGGVLVTGRTSYIFDSQNEIYIAKVSGDVIPIIEWSVICRDVDPISNDLGYKSIQLEDSGYVVVGIKSFAGDQDIVVIRLDKYGNVLWSNSYGGPNQDWGYSVLQNQDGKLIISGTTTGNPGAPGGMDMYILALELDGSISWATAVGTIHDEWGYNATITSDSCILITGRTNHLGTDDAYIAKLNSSGSLLWAKSAGGNGSDYGYGASEDNNGNYIIAGKTQSHPGTGEDYYFIKMSADGSINTSLAIGGVYEDLAYDVSIINDKYYIVGMALSYGNDIGSKYDIYLVEVGSDCNIDAAYTVGFQGSDEWGLGSSTTSDGDIFVIGNSDKVPDDIFFTKITPGEITNCCYEQATFSSDSVGEYNSFGFAGGSVSTEPWGLFYSGGSIADECDSSLLSLGILEFEGAIEDQRVRLSWHTSDHYPANHFKLFRIDETTNFNEVLVDSNISIEESDAYIIYDESLNLNQIKNRNLIYKLVSIGQNGKVMESAIATISSIANQDNIVVYPSPANNFISLRVPYFATGVLTIQIINSNGMVVKTLFEHQTTQGITKLIDISDLSTGTYLVTITSYNQQESLPFIIAR